MSAAGEKGVAEEFVTERFENRVFALVEAEEVLEMMED